MTDTLPHAAPAEPLDGHPRHLLLVSVPPVAGPTQPTQAPAARAGSPRLSSPPGPARPPLEGTGRAPAAVERPSIPPRLRTITYFVLLITSWAVLLVSGLAPIWLETTDMQRILATCGVVSSVLGAIAGGLGVAYRPTADPKT
ncbi:hypothetical protein [Cellulomonas sp. Marseille-Q8402]